MTGIIAQNVGRTSGLIKAASGGTGGVWTKIKTLTASASADLSFVDGTDDVVLDSTYPIYLFKFINIHPETDGVDFQVNFRDGGSSYDAIKTTTLFGAYQAENDSEAGLPYDTGRDLAQSTAVQPLNSNGSLGNGNDECASGELWLFSPSSTTYVKHFISKLNYYNSGDYSINSFMAGYCNVTAAIDGVQFTASSDNIDAGTIKLYGIGDS